jgi:hypothetical protein
MRRPDALARHDHQGHRPVFPGLRLERVSPTQSEAPKPSDLTTVPPAVVAAADKNFGVSDMKIVQRAKERSLPLVTVNVAMFNRVRNPKFGGVWITVLIVKP